MAVQKYVVCAKGDEKYDVYYWDRKLFDSSTARDAVESNTGTAHGQKDPHRFDTRQEAEDHVCQGG